MENTILPETREFNTTRNTAAALVFVAMVGTGGALLSETSRIDTPTNKQYQMVKVSSASFHVEKGDKLGGPNLQFQKGVIALMETYGFNIKQYAEYMKVTRATIYSWLNIKKPIRRVKSVNRIRLDDLSKALIIVKEDRASTFGVWLLNPLDDLTSKVKNLLSSDGIELDAFYELAPKINSALRSETSRIELDDLLGL